MLRQAGVESADLLFDTNDKWQHWRGRKAGFDYVLNYPQMVETLIEKIASGDPSITFADEEDDGINELEQ